MLRFVVSILVCIVLTQGAIAQSASKGKIVTEQLNSTILKDNLVGLNPARKVIVYLPPGYATSNKSYPVVFYFHSIYGKAEMILHDSSNAHQLLERTFAGSAAKEFIFVAPDFSSGNIGSMYENSPVSGRWLDYATQELVPFIDRKYRTIKHRDSRAAIGDFMGGRGALQLGMTHADVFGVVYALHPVAVGVGTRPWTDLGINWEKILNAKSFADFKGDMACEIFVSICQAFLPNPSRPPLYCDYFMKKENGKIVPDTENMIKAQHGFHLEETLNETYKDLKSLRGLAFDWARFDGNFDHIHAARAFTRNLEDLGVEHEAEEYRGTPWNKTWGEDGRFNTRVLPFLFRHLVFEGK